MTITPNFSLSEFLSCKAKYDVLIASNAPAASNHLNPCAQAFSTSQHHLQAALLEKSLSYIYHSIQKVLQMASFSYRSLH